MSSKQKDSSFSENMIKYIYGIADNSLILGQRLGELTGHGRFRG